MQEIDQKQKNRYIKGIVLNLIIVLVIMTAVYTILMPRYEKIDTLISTINSTRAATFEIQNNGISGDTFLALAKQYNKQKELGEDIFANPERLEKILKKPAGESDYLAWASKKAGEKNIIDSEIEKNDHILGNIIPNYTNTVTSRDEDTTLIKNQITLQSFIKYIEKEIIAKYSLTSFVPIGINNVSFDTAKNSASNIGSFKITLDFTAKNSDILSFLTAIHKSGTLTIRDGKLISNNKMTLSDTSSTSDLSNLLIGVKSLSMASILENNEKPNTGTVVLEFFVEGINYQKILILRNNILEKVDGRDAYDQNNKKIRIKWLKENIQLNGNVCVKWDNPLCQNSLTNGAVFTIKNLGKSMAELQPILDEFRKWLPITDPNKEFDRLVILQSTIRNIQMIYNRNVQILTKAQEKNTRK